MRWAERLRDVPAAAVAGFLVVMQLVVAWALARDGGWDYSVGEAAGAAALLAATVVLLYGVGRALGGPLFALGAAALWIAAPVLLLWRYWRIGGNPPTDFAGIYHGEVLPAAFGLEARSAVLAGGLLLASAWVVLAVQRQPLAAAAGAGALAGAAALAHPRVWPALLAPGLAYAIARRPRSAAAAAAATGAAAVGLAALALFRHVPDVPLAWHQMGLSLSSVREFSWSARLLEYLPLAGAIGIARRSAAAGTFFGWLLLTLIILPLGRSADLAGLLIDLVPALPVYALLTASLVYLVPRRHAAPAGSLPRARPRSRPASRTSSDPRSGRRSRA